MFMETVSRLEEKWNLQLLLVTCSSDNDASLFQSCDSVLSNTLHTGYFQKHATHSLGMYTLYSEAFHVLSGTRR